MTTRAATQPEAPAETNRMRCYLGSSRSKEVVITMSPEEYKRSNRLMREAERGPFFFDQVTDLTTGKKFDLYREHCGGGCWCAARAKPAKAMLMKMSLLPDQTVRFVCQDGSGAFRVRADEYTKLELGGKEFTFVYVAKTARAFEILGNAPPQTW